LKKRGREMRVLVVEDDPQVAEAISLCLKTRWPGADIAFSSMGRQGIKLYQEKNPDLILLDLILPDVDGFEVLKEIRSLSSAVSIIILTVRGEEMEVIRGLELGADDYILKPFNHTEFLARVKTVLRRCQRPQLLTDVPPLVLGDLTIDPLTEEVRVCGRSLNLTPIEYKLLHSLASNEGRILTHETLLSRVWGGEYSASPEYLKVYIQRLRNKLEEDPKNPRLVLTQRGMGYKLVRPVSHDY
jgi:two-component system KDP operon response regulator KdpE